MQRIATPYLCVGLLALTAAAFLPLWNNDYVDFDDELYITANQNVLRGLTPSGFRWAWTNFDAKYWQPLSWLSLQFDAHLFWSKPPDGKLFLPARAVHVENLLWHCGSVLLLFAVLLRLTGARWRSLFVAAVFAVHPMRVESVAWAAERKDVLCVFFGLLAILAYARYVQKRSVWRYLAVLATYALSLLAKPMLITLPFVLLLLDYWPLRRARTSARWLVVEKLPLFTLAAACATITLLAREQNGAAMSLAQLPLSARLGNAAAAYGWYVLQTLRPWPLAMLYPHPYLKWSLPAALAGIAVITVVTAFAVWQARSRPWFIVGWLWFLGTLVPVIGLTQGGEQAWADRFTYWPHIGFFVAVSWGLGEAVARLRLPSAASGLAAGFAVAALAMLTWMETGYWHDTETIWTHTLGVTHENHRAHLNLGRCYFDRGRFDLAMDHFAEAVRIQPAVPYYHFSYAVGLQSLGKEEESTRHYEEAIRLDSNFPDAWFNLGRARLRLEKPEAAIACFRTALILQPQSNDARAGLGRSLWLAGRRQEGIETLQEALRFNENESDAWYGMGVVHLAEGRPNAAIDALSRAAALKPHSILICSDLGLAFSRAGQWREAIAWQLTAVQDEEKADQLLEAWNGQLPMLGSFRRTVVLQCRLAFACDNLGDRAAAKHWYQAALANDPDWPQKFSTQATSLATSSDVNARDAQLAYELASQATEAVANPSAAFLDSLATAQAALGKYQDAVQSAQQAIAKAEIEGNQSQANDIRSRLQLYQQGKPQTPANP